MRHYISSKGVNNAKIYVKYFTFYLLSNSFQKSFNEFIFNYFPIENAKIETKLVWYMHVYILVVVYVPKNVLFKPFEIPIEN